MSVSGLPSFKPAQMAELNQIKQQYASAAANGNISPKESKELEASAKKFALANNITNPTDIKAITEHLSSGFSPDYSAATNAIRSGLTSKLAANLAETSKGAEQQENESIWGKGARMMKQSLPDAVTAVVLPFSDRDAKTGDTKEQTVEQKKAGQAKVESRSNANSAKFVSAFNNAVDTHCVGKALSSTGNLKAGANVPAEAHLDTKNLQGWTGKEWTGISASGTMSAKEKAFANANAGKSLVQMGRHTEVFAGFDKDGGIKLGNGKTISKEEIASGVVNIFVPAKADGIKDNAQGVDKRVHDFKNFSIHNADLDPSKNASPDARNVKKFMVLMTDPAMKQASSKIAELASKTPADYDGIKALLKTKGIEMNDKSMKSLISTMSAELSPPMKLKDNYGHEVKGANGKPIEFKNVFQALQKLTSEPYAPLVKNNIIRLIEHTDSENTKATHTADGEESDKGKVMMKELQALINGDDGC
ncbi:MAG: hypothetical protein AABZ74_04560 [Cyanobacteriota bacterium]